MLSRALVPLAFACAAIAGVPAAKKNNKTNIKTIKSKDRKTA